MSHPYPEKWIDDQLDALDFDNITDAADTLWGKSLIEKARKMSEYLYERTAKLIEQLKKEIVLEIGLETGWRSALDWRIYGRSRRQGNIPCLLFCTISPERWPCRHTG